MREKKPLSQISFSWSSLNLKVSIDEEMQKKEVIYLSYHKSS